MKPTIHKDCCILGKGGENGYLYPYGDEKAFAGYIKALYEDKALCEKIGANNRKAAVQYGLEAVYPQVTAELSHFMPKVPREVALAR